MYSSKVFTFIRGLPADTQYLTKHIFKTRIAGTRLDFYN